MLKCWNLSMLKSSFQESFFTIFNLMWWLHSSTQTNLLLLVGDVARFVGPGKPNNSMIIICVEAWKEDYNLQLNWKDFTFSDSMIMMLVIPESIWSVTLFSKMSKLFSSKNAHFLQQYASSDHIGDNDNHDKYTDHEENNIDNVVVVVLLKWPIGAGWWWWGCCCCWRCWWWGCCCCCFLKRWPWTGGTRRW